MLDGQRQLLAVATQIEVAVAPGMELGGAAQGLAGADASSALPGVVHDEHGDAVPTLQLAQIGEQRRDLAAGVLVDAVQPHERIEDEQTGPQLVDGLGEVAPIGLEVEAQRRRGDDLDIEIGEHRAGGDSDAVEAAADDVQRILGGVKQDASGLGHDEAAQAGRAGGDRDSEVESQERLAALGLAADDSDGLLRPQPGDEPAMLFGALGQATGGLDGQHAHQRLIARCRAGLASDDGGVAHISRNSFSSM